MNSVQFLGLRAVYVLCRTVEGLTACTRLTSVRSSQLKQRIHHRSKKGEHQTRPPVTKPPLMSTQQESISAYSFIRFPLFSTSLIATESDFVLSDSHTKQFISFLPVVIKEPIFTLNFSSSFASSWNRFDSILSTSYRLIRGSGPGNDQSIVRV